MSSQSDDSLPESETLSLCSTYKETIEIGGRVYQQLALEQEITFTPVDEIERESLDKQHRIFQYIFDERLIFPPIENPERILDCGYGSAAWAFDVAEKYPDCQVIGIDITPHMKPEEMPRNLWLQIDDLNEPFTFQDKFDLVHSRNVAQGIDKGRWRSYIGDCARVVKPGGWLQFIEPYHVVQSDNGTLTDDHAVRQFSMQYSDVLEGKKDVRAAMHLEAWFREAGLVDVEYTMIPIPLNAWSTNPRDRHIGELANGAYKEAIGSHCIYLFQEYLSMTTDEIHVLLARARQDADNPSLRPYIPMYVCVGRKPNS
ncbi:S-adenosyl-L-methionine-dependent methyltransferase [Pyronema domesticum]|uniref:S-adenosyl-L-methionine-dependent methyltransferase n=1 Tax=Pyronema omphalodes (strain CBS 100304) TaxID=1076935 RepID=U4LNS9_PYROM|nr:S-adenosyl-L-methionine-dependent methyltransferase [Pyronema domesticum]CCX16239.1 Similar to hypothetical protein [Tuber melanosporum Mel28]; acc. no. XP_002836176 [Pyronema omphalodes CBS 100304]